MQAPTARPQPGDLDPRSALELLGEAGAARALNSRRQGPRNMTEKHTRLWLSDAAKAVLLLDVNAPAPGNTIGSSLSERATTVLLRYAMLVREHMPAFTFAEWMALCRALRGYWLNPVGDTDPAQWIQVEIADAQEMAAQWDVPMLELARRVGELSYVEKVALLDCVTRFWSREALNEPALVALEFSGARFVRPPMPTPVPRDG